jgi:hypothetical protein
MPRKRLDPATEVLAYFTTQPYEVAVVVLNLARAMVQTRAPQPTAEKPKRQQVRKAKAPVIDEPSTVVYVPPIPDVVAPAPGRRRTKRLTADSPKPVSEATPIVPLVETVGEGGEDGAEQYAGD